MRSKRSLRVVLFALACAAALLACTTTPTGNVAGTGVPRLRVYALYCGEAQIPDISPWSPGFNVGKPMTFSDNCYLIRHGNDWMLWDSGFADSLADSPDGQLGARGMRMKRTKTLASQLAELRVSPAQISVLAFSHAHADHVGNANLFTNATLYVQQPEYDAMFGPEPAKFGFNPALYDKLRNNPVVKLSGDKDIFGDASVVIVSTPGHTPGHQSLVVRLPKTGTLVLSGDAAHFRENFDNRRVPGFNFNKEQSVASMDRIAQFLLSERAQLWINHDSEQNATIPHSPQFVE
ncbi:MAG TPA: N-acyl homoserine lactonase family protein [Burkholderiaceae bacterium]|nr:N-acyl homoserine lactonase family protein [Burkholderiaceae bacterium]